MVEIRPFKATILNPELETRAELVCPVYDTIDAQQYERYAADRNNVIHFSTRKEGVAEDDFVDYAKLSLERLFAEGILKGRDHPAFYIYGIRYSLSRSLVEQIPREERREVYFAFGLVTLVKVDKLNEHSIVGHEKTFETKTRERSHLMKACGMNFSPIVAEYNMPGHEINNIFEDYLGFHRPDLELDEQRKPVMDVVINGARHLLWEVADKDVIDKIQQLVREKRIMILDGHHRYTAAYQVSKDQEEGTAYTLMMLVEGGDRALLLLPWHRCVRQCRREELWARIADYFTVESYDKRAGEAQIYSRLNESTDEFDVRFGMYDGEKYYVLRADKERIGKLAEARGERVGLDVISLHEWLIGPTLIGEPEDVVFTASPQEAIEKVDKEAYEVAFFLRRLRIADVEYKAHVEKKVFPQKSTLFLPKVAEGIVMWKWK
ncbi:MAG: DUF1015 family protein [Methanomicrobia archaeon]|nr:DUF1015 family protein [Methanomicrobia archaeon]